MNMLDDHRIDSKCGPFVHRAKVVNAQTALGHEVCVIDPKATRNDEFASDDGAVARRVGIDRRGFAR